MVGCRNLDAALAKRSLGRLDEDARRRHGVAG
jgi:hypothetical protein